jgi:hypothetical protein
MYFYFHHNFSLSLVGHCNNIPRLIYDYPCLLGREYRSPATTHSRGSSCDRVFDDGRRQTTFLHPIQRVPCELPASNRGRLICSRRNVERLASVTDGSSRTYFASSGSWRLHLALIMDEHAEARYQIDMFNVNL